MKNQGTYIFLGLILIGLLSFLIFKPSATANAVADSTAKCEDKLSVSDSKLAAAQSELASCNQLKAAAITDMNKLQNPQAASACDTSDLEARINDLTRQRTSIMKNLKDAQDAAKECTGDANVVDELNNTITELGRNSANNICCKMRVDNPNIKAYNLEGNKVNCVESGDLLLTCP